MIISQIIAFVVACTSASIPKMKITKGNFRAALPVKDLRKYMFSTSSFITTCFKYSFMAFPDPLYYATAVLPTCRPCLRFCSQLCVFF